MLPIHTWNLTESSPKPILLPPLSFGDGLVPIREVEHLPVDGPVILYIVGHGVPDGLFRGNVVLAERKFARRLQTHRKNGPTLVIFDLCFSQSIEQVEGQPWPQNFVLVLSCRAHERTWHTGEGIGKPQRQSMFAAELDIAIATQTPGAMTWASLQARLREQFGGLQQPKIVAGPLSPSDFELDRPKGAGVKRTADGRTGPYHPPLE